MMRIKRLLTAVAGALALLVATPAAAQVDAEQVMTIGRNVLSMDDYMLSIQYFNQAIKAKPYLADPYFYRAFAKLSLEDYKGAEEDCTLAIERNKFKPESYRLRGFARQALGKDSLAIADYDTGLSYNPQDKYFLFYKSVAQTELKKYDEADSTFSVLLRLYPSFEEGFTARGRLNMVRGDTVAALADISKAIEFSNTLIQPYLLRADIETRQQNWEGALADLDEAIHLKPHEADFYVNRAFIRYNMDDYFGAMADYNYTLELEPYNTPALFNRALLRYEVKDLDRAAADLSSVLNLSPDNFHARYNLGLVNLERGHNKEALADFDEIARRYPRFYQVYYARAEALRNMGNMKAAMQNVRHADELVKGYVADPETHPLDRPAIQAGTANADGQAPREDEPEEEVMNRFNQLVTVGAASDTHLSYNDRIKGRVQDRDVTVEPEPTYLLSFQDSPASLKATSNYFRELDDFNQQRYIRQRIYLSPMSRNEVDSASYASVFQLADYYSELTSLGDARPADWLALGVARTMLKDFDAAIRALDAAIAAYPDFAMAYLERGFARQYSGDPRQMTLAIADYDAALKLNPRLIYVWFNKGNLYYDAADWTSALECYSEALRRDPSFGPALYNRGITYLRMGNKRQAFADLSRAGELGVLPSYNLIKRMK